LGIDIIDPADPRLVDYRNVPDGELLERRGLFVAEGRLVVTRLLAGGRFRARSVLVTAPAHRALAGALDVRPDVPVYVVPQAVMNTVSGFDVHRGCLAVGERPPRPAWTVVAGAARTIVVLERVANADNVGGVFRNAAALGGDAVLLDPATTDPLYRKAIRTSMGAALQVPFARMEPWPDALDALHAAGVTIIGMTPSAGARPLPEVAAMHREQRVAVLLGQEGDGLTTQTLSRCDTLARIPMSAGVDSVNIASAAAICLYELSRRSANH
jgi:tRNA G18 (ribose-2'-O)-methylase SpoU